MYFQTYENLLSHSECKNIYEYIYNNEVHKSDGTKNVSGFLNSSTFLENIINKLHNRYGESIILQPYDQNFKYTLYLESNVNVYKNIEDRTVVLIIYLNDGGETIFHKDNEIIKIKNEIGKAILFDGNIFEIDENMYKKIILLCNLMYVSFDNLRI